MIFDDRHAAGTALAAQLRRLRGTNPIVLALPRGGVPVGAAVAEALDATLDVIIVRKLGVPYQPELGMGAIGEDGVRVLNDEILRIVRVSEAELSAVEARERAELDRRVARYRGDRPMLPLVDRTVIIVDDGIATGGTMRAALAVARAHGAAHIVLAVPVASGDTLRELAPLADEVIALQTPDDMVAIGYWYRNFRQTSDAEVGALLSHAHERTAARKGDPPVRIERDVAIPIESQRLGGSLCVPAEAAAIVVFAHGSGSSRHSPRNRSVAAALNDAGLGTLLFDLLSVDEELDRGNLFDVELLGERLREVTRWLRTQPEAKDCSIGYFGASTGAAAALWAAAAPGADIAAVVSRGGRPDLARERLADVRAPVLFIVGSRDEIVTQLNRDAARQLRTEHHIEIVPGASHLFEEPGTLAVAAQLAANWFVRHARPVPATSS